MRDEFVGIEAHLELLRTKLEQLVEHSDDPEITDDLRNSIVDLERVIERLRRYRVREVH